MIHLYRKILGLLLPALFFLPGCENNLGESGGWTDSGQILGEDLIFTATIESDATKTLLAGLPGGPRAVHWSADDSIRINGIRYNVLSLIAVDSTSATFSPHVAGGQAAPVGGKYKAYYPASLYNGDTPTLPEVQTYRGLDTLSTGGIFPKISNLPMYAESTTTQLTFKNLCAVLNFRLTGEDKVTRIEITSKEKALWGPFSVSSDKARIDATATDAKYRKLRLNCNVGGGVQLNSTTPTDFFVAVPADDYTSEDLTITVFSGTTKVLATMTNNLGSPTAKMSLPRSSYAEIEKDVTVYVSASMGFVVRSSASDRTFVLPFKNGDVFPTDVTIHWGDADNTERKITKNTLVTDALKAFTYKATDTGDHTIQIIARAPEKYMNDVDCPQIPLFSFYSSTDVSKSMVVRFLTPLLRQQHSSEGISFRDAFSDLTNLEEIPGNLFANNPEAWSFVSVFNGCTSLKGPIPENLFAQNTEALSFTEAFKGCSGLKGPIPENLFANNKKVTSFAAIFQDCFGLSGSIPENLFANNTNASTFRETFQNCFGLTGSIPANLFANNKNVTSFRNTFNGCSGLTGSIPANLFASNTKVTHFQSTFKNCSGLSGSIPANLFAASGQTVETFSDAFNGCSGLSGSIPVNLFAKNTKVTEFISTFANCEKLTSIPANLFAQNTEVMYFNDLFNGCIALSSIPANLFAKNTKAVGFNRTFSGCIGLTGPIPANLFDNTQGVAFVEAFYDCSGLTGAAPSLWTRSGAYGNGCFGNCTGLSNYASIPNNWK